MASELGGLKMDRAERIARDMILDLSLTLERTKQRLGEREPTDTELIDKLERLMNFGSDNPIPFVQQASDGRVILGKTCGCLGCRHNTLTNSADGVSLRDAIALFKEPTDGS